MPEDHHHLLPGPPGSPSPSQRSPRQERLALAGFLAGYTGLTREAYALGLRQYASWCQHHHLPLFQARRADIECFARDMEARGRARATITRRLCAIAGFYRHAREEEFPRPLPGRACPPPAPGL